MRISATSASAAVLLAAAGAPAMAGPLDYMQLYYSGEITLGNLDIDNTDALQYFDFDLDFRLNFGPEFGIAGGADVLGEFNAGLRDRYTFYGFYEFAENQEVQVGYLPSPIDILLAEDRLAYGEFLTNTTLQLLTAPLLTTLMYFDGEEPWGVGYRGEFGPVEVASALHFNRVGDGEIISLAGTYESALNTSLDYWFGGGLEHVLSDTAPSQGRYFAAAGVGNEMMWADLNVAVGDLAFGGDRATSVDLTFQYSPQIGILENIDLGVDLTYVDFENSGNDLRVAAIGAEYTDDSGLGVSVGTGRSDNGGFEQEWLAIEAFLSF